MNHRKRVPYTSVDPLDVLPRSVGVVVNRKLAKAKVILVQHNCDVQDLAGVDAAVRLDVASHPIDECRQGFASSGSVGVVVNDVGLDNGLVIHRPDTLVPMNVAGEVGINVVLDEERLESVAHILLIRGHLRGVHWSMGLKAYQVSTLVSERVRKADAGL